MRSSGMDCWLIGKTHMKADDEGMAFIGIDPSSEIGMRVEQCGFNVGERDDGIRPEGPDGLYDETGAVTYNEYLCEKGYDSANPWHDFANSVRETVIPACMGLIKQCDDQMGRLFQYFNDNGRWDDTLIVLTCDHGDYLGDHWMGEKDLFHEPAVKIPLIIRDPFAQRAARHATLWSKGSTLHRHLRTLQVVKHCRTYSKGGHWCPGYMVSIQNGATTPSANMTKSAAWLR